MERKFYVSAINGSRRHLVAGPYESHDAALAKVDTVRKMADERDSRAHFMAWGTASGDHIYKTPLGVV